MIQVRTKNDITDIGKIKPKNVTDKLRSKSIKKISLYARPNQSIMSRRNLPVSGYWFLIYFFL